MADLSDFQIKEYENISQAHFKTNEMIVAFFRYYLLILALPIPFVGTLFGFFGDAEDVARFSSLQAPIAIFVFGIALLGFFIMCYLTGLRCEAILYARTVNLVRKYFFEKEGFSVDHMLPINSDSPSMKKSRDHIFIVYSFAVIDSIYLAAAFSLFSLTFSVTGNQITSNAGQLFVFGLAGLFSLSLAAHVGTHKLVCSKRDATSTAKTFTQ